MPDYNRKAAAFWWFMVSAGVGCLAYSMHRLALAPTATRMEVVIGVLLAMAAGMFPVRIPRTNQSFSAGDLIIYSLLLSHGAPAGAFAAGLEALVSAWRTSSRWTTRLGSASIATTTMLGTGWLLQAVLEHPAFGGVDHNGLLVVVAALFGPLYLTCNATLMFRNVPFPSEEMRGMMKATAQEIGLPQQMERHG